MKKTLLIIVLTIMGFSTIIGALFKIMHWRGGNEMILVGMGSMGLMYIFLIVNIVQYPIKNKWSWILAALMSPLTTAITYFANREDLTEIE